MQCGMYSLWHFCLYGHGKLPAVEFFGSDPLPIFISAKAELQKRLLEFSGNTKSPDSSSYIGLTQGRCREFRYRYYESRFHQGRDEDSISGSFSRLKHLLLNTHPTDDRSRYDFLATFSVLRYLHEISALITQEPSLVCDSLVNILNKIDDPFLYSRAATFLAFGFSLRKNHSLACGLHTIYARFTNDIEALLSRRPDAVHSGPDFVVFSACLLGHALLTLSDPENSDSQPITESLLKISQRYFDTLKPDSRASQFTFLNMFMAKSPHYDREILAAKFCNLTESFCRDGDLRSKYAYLRAAYLLVEAAASAFHISSRQSDFLLDILVLRLRKITTETSVVYSEFSKYDNDVLCFCYSFVAAHYYPNMDLIEALEQASNILSTTIETMVDDDLFKLLNCCLPSYADDI